MTSANFKEYVWKICCALLFPLIFTSTIVSVNKRRSEGKNLVSTLNVLILFISPPVEWMGLRFSHLLHPLLWCVSNWLRESEHLCCCRGNGMRDGARTARWWGTRLELMGILCLHSSSVTKFSASSESIRFSSLLYTTPRYRVHVYTSKETLRSERNPRKLNHRAYMGE